LRWVSSNKGKGRLTKIVDGSGSTAFTFNVLGKVLNKVTVIWGKTYTTSFVYTLNGKLPAITEISILFTERICSSC
jgi:hypothetical protein